jgi:hypothetical protein
MATRRASRRPQGASEWASHLEAQARSGLGVAAYCRQAGISEWSFYYWRKRRAAASGTLVPQSQPSFVEVLRTAPATAVGYRVEFRNGHALQIPSGFGADELRELVGIVAERD